VETLPGVPLGPESSFTIQADTRRPKSFSRQSAQIYFLIFSFHCLIKMRKIFTHLSEDTLAGSRALSSLSRRASLALPASFIHCERGIFFEINKIILRNYISPSLALFASKKAIKKPLQEPDEDVEVLLDIKSLSLPSLPCLFLLFIYLFINYLKFLYFE
jgi:hypothetical protein